jgi:hypothetical protein
MLGGSIASGNAAWVFDGLSGAAKRGQAADA